MLPFLALGSVYDTLSDNGGDPLCLYDCDVPVDGSVACIVSRTDDPAIDYDRAVRFEAIGSATGFDRCAEMMWSRTNLRPRDVGFAELYDGFSVLAVLWLEALGLCPYNGGGKFIEGGERISRSGVLPLNTGGGQLSGGRLHGYGHLLQACKQLRGGDNVAELPKRPSVCVVSSGVADFASCLLLSGPKG